MRMIKWNRVALAALALLSAPALAKNATPQKVDSEEPPPSCSSYQLDQNGNWTPLPCRELGTDSSSQHRAPAKPHDHETR